MTHSLHSLLICSTHDSFPLTLIIDHDSLAPLVTHPLTIQPLTLPHRHCGLPVYKSAIWVPCSLSSDLVTILYILCNNQLDSPCSSLCATALHCHSIHLLSL